MKWSRFVTLSPFATLRVTGRAVLLPRHRQRRAFCLLSPLLAIPATPHHPRPSSM